MGDPRAFLKLGRAPYRERPKTERVLHSREFSEPYPDAELRDQASRCMDCGIPFCHSACPLGNVIPEWNDLTYRGETDRAIELLLSTNNFPEVTGRVCPAPCEGSCVLALQDEPVHIKAIEKALGDALDARGFVPHPPRARSGRSVAVVGSGPAGLAAAQELARRGHAVTVYDEADRPGGLLRYGIPDFKLEKSLVDRRITQMEAEGIAFALGARVRDLEPLRAAFDAVVLALGARVARDLLVPGRDLGNVHFAMPFLEGHNRAVAGLPVASPISATGKRVVVLGGGDTGSDCVGTSHRQGAASVLQLELLPKPPLQRHPDNPWPEWPMVYRTSSSQEEGGTRDFALLTKELRGADGKVASLSVVRVVREEGAFREVPATQFEIPCDLVLLAMGFSGPEPELATNAGVALDARGNVRTESDGSTNVPGVFAAGDASRGQSLVVWAIADGRRVARGVDAYVTRSYGSSVQSETSVDRAENESPR